MLPKRTSDKNLKKEKLNNRRPLVAKTGAEQQYRKVSGSEGQPDERP